MCDRLPQYTAKHSTPKLPNMSQSVINFFYQSPSEYTLQSISLIMIQYRSYTSLINYAVFQGCHLVLARKKCFLPQQIPVAYTEHLVISILEEEWWGRVVTVVYLTVLVCLSWRCQAPSLGCATPLECLYLCSSYLLTCIEWMSGSLSSSPPLILTHDF